MLGLVGLAWEIAAWVERSYGGSGYAPDVITPILIPILAFPAFVSLVVMGRVPRAFLGSIALVALGATGVGLFVRGLGTYERDRIVFWCVLHSILVALSVLDVLHPPTHVCLMIHQRRMRARASGSPRL